MSLIIAGERSGVGKTTITLALLAFLVEQKDRIQSFKVGPDYIDPMFHSTLTGIPCRNLDPVLTSPEYVRSSFGFQVQRAEYALIEGVMGLFDGVEFPESPLRDKTPHCSLISDYGSTAYIARLLDIPVVLVFDCSRLSASVAAIAYGYKNLDPQVKIAGVILNQVSSDRHLELLKNALYPLNLPILGVLRREDKISIPDRHLGLIPTEELPQSKEIFARLAHLGKTCFNWDLLLPLLKSKTSIKFFPQLVCQKPQTPIKLAIARDRAFNFYYQDNLDILEELGAELVFWSPLEDSNLPPDIGGLYFGGGFPEIFAEELSSNREVCTKVKKAIADGLPVYAECGGLMYLCDRLVDLQGTIWSMVGAIPTTTTMTSRLTLGYRQVIPLRKTVLINQEMVLTDRKLEELELSAIWGHEFHRSQVNPVPQNPIWQMQGCGKHSPISYDGWQLKKLHASYLHLHFGESKNLPKNFLSSCRKYLDRLG